jgi:hypothetical protein
MKRKIFHLNNIEVITPSNKRIKLNHIKITLKNKMTDQEFNDELEELLQKRPYSNAQPLPKEDYNSLEENSLNDQSNSDSDFKDSIYNTSEDESIMSHDSIKTNKGQDNESISSHDTIESDDDTQSTSTEQLLSHVLTPKNEPDEFEEIAEKLAKMDKWIKGEQQEEKIKELLQKQNFIITKTQSTARNKEIIGDNGVDHFGSIRLNNQMIRFIIQSKNWKNPIPGTVVRDLEGTINRYPGHIGIIVINGGGCEEKAQNLAINSRNTILIYNFKDLKNLKRDLKLLSQRGKLRIESHSIETIDKVKIIEKRGNNTRTIKGTNYRRYNAY